MKQRSRKQLKKRLRIIVPIALLIVIGLGLYWLIKPAPQKTLTSQSASNEQAGKPAAVASNPTNTSTSPNPNPNVPGGTTGSGVSSQAVLVAPTGTFVNNHGANSAYPVTTDTNEASTCTTTPGASCDIQFTNTVSGSVEDLGALTLPATGSGNLSSGSVSWQWTPSGKGLSSGTWKITAIATLDGQSKSTTDQLNLTVQ
jgi:cytoskeletal protein RodZ